MSNNPPVPGIQPAIAQGAASAAPDVVPGVHPATYGDQPSRTLWQSYVRPGLMVAGGTALGYGVGHAVGHLVPASLEYTRAGQTLIENMPIQQQMNILRGIGAAAGTLGGVALLTSHHLSDAWAERHRREIAAQQQPVVPGIVRTEDAP